MKHIRNPTNVTAQLTMGTVKQALLGPDMSALMILDSEGDLQRVEVRSELIKSANLDHIENEQVICSTRRAEIIFPPPDGSAGESQEILHVLSGPMQGKTLRYTDGGL